MTNLFHINRPINILTYLEEQDVNSFKLGSNWFMLPSGSLNEIKITGFKLKFSSFQTHRFTYKIFIYKQSILPCIDFQRKIDFVSYPILWVLCIEMGQTLLQFGVLNLLQHFKKTSWGFSLQIHYSVKSSEHPAYFFSYNGSVTVCSIFIMNYNYPTL